VDFVKAEVIKEQIQRGLGSSARYKVKTSNSNKGVLQLRCVEYMAKRSECKWHLYCSFKESTARVTSSGMNHTCVADAPIPGAVSQKKGRQRSPSYAVISAGNAGVQQFTSVHGAKRAAGILLATSRRDATLPSLTKNQAALHAPTANRPDISAKSCIYEYSKLASFMLKMQDHDPLGTYKVGFCKHKYTSESKEVTDLLQEIPGGGLRSRFCLLLYFRECVQQLVCDMAAVKTHRCL